jgi:hypothetical protein
VETVPLPGVTEHLLVTLDLGFVPGGAATPRPPGLRATCAVSQTGRETVYTAATDYGSKFKIFAAVSLVLEAGAAAAYLLRTAPSADQIAAGSFLAADAAATGVLLLVPKRERYERSERQATIPIRGDCPDGLTVELDGQPVAVGPGGGIDDDGQRLFQQHMLRSSLPMRVRFGDRAADAVLTPSDRCRWARVNQHPAMAAMCAGVDQTWQRGEILVGLDVAPGTTLGPRVRTARAAPAPTASQP